MENKRDIFYIEALRCIGCFFVIFNHTNTEGFFLFSTCPIGSIQFWLYLALSVFCKLSVPLFFMISGALLLKRQDETITSIMKRRVLRLFFALMLFSLIYYLDVNVILKQEQFSLATFFQKIYTCQITSAYWYIYAYIAFLIGLPLLRKLVCGLNNEHYCYMFIIAFIMIGLIPVLEYVLCDWRYRITGNLSEWFLANSVLYPLLGYYFENAMDMKKIKKAIPFLWIINILCIVITCYVSYIRIIKSGECSEGTSQLFHDKFVLVNATTIFLTLKYYLRNVQCDKSLVTKYICSIGKCSLVFI